MDPIYRIDDVRDKVLGLLRKRKCSMFKGDIALELDLPLWAVTAALHSAEYAQLVVDISNGWMLADQVEQAPVAPGQVTDWSAA